MTGFHPRSAWSRSRHPRLAGWAMLPACWILIAPAAAHSQSKDDVVVEPAATAYNWSGTYVGGFLGWSQFGSDWHDVDGWIADMYDAGSDGVLAGAVIGYNRQLTNNIVLGIEADLAYTSNKRSFDPAGCVGCVDLESKMDLFGTVRARAGYAFDRFLPYVTGGLAVGHFKHQWTENDDPSYNWPDFGGAETGWALGAGAEYALNDHWTAKAEYLHADFGDVTSANDYGLRMKVDRSVNTARFGMN